VALFNAEGSGAALATVATLTTLTLVLPSFTTSVSGPEYNTVQLVFAALASAALYGAFVVTQTVRHRDFFLPVDVPVDVLILTALEDELKAVLALSQDWSERKDLAGFPYHHASFPRTGNKRPLVIAAAWPGKMGEMAVALVNHLVAPDDPAQAFDLSGELEGLIRRRPEQWHMLQPNWPSDRPGARRVKL